MDSERHQADRSTAQQTGGPLSRNATLSHTSGHCLSSRRGRGAGSIQCARVKVESDGTQAIIEETWTQAQEEVRLPMAALKISAVAQRECSVPTLRCHWGLRLRAC